MLHQDRRPPLAADARTFGTWGDLNLLGLWTLYVKEVRRFLKVLTQTVLAPMMTTLMFLAIFALALGGTRRVIGGVPFLEFLAPGLLMMAVVQNAFANTSSSLMIAKVQGNIVDYLMPPLGPGELTFGLVMGGVTRGLLVAVAVWVAMLPFVELLPLHPLAMLASLLLASNMLSLLGLIAALWAEKFDQMAAVTNFVITPLSFLSGTFYSISDLPEPLHLIALANPFFYMIDGVRWAFTGHADGPVLGGYLVLVAVNLALWLAAWWLLRRGYKLKA
jgi:ABC-2 type transport system permease protein